jgi:proline iminopeptidase
MNARGRIMSVLVSALLFVASLAADTLSLKQQAGKNAGTETRESIFHNVVDIGTGIIRQVPEVPPLCDQIPGPAKQWVKVGDCRLYVETEGEGEPLVLINGGPGGTHHSFHPSFSRAARFSQVVYYDQRGCGQSDYKKGAGYSVSQAVEDLDKLRAALKIDKWTVLGWSYGGLLAQYYLIRHPEHVRGLVLVGASPALELGLDDSRQGEFLCRREMMRIRDIHGDTTLSEEQSLYNAFLAGDWKRQNYYRPSTEQIARLARYEWKQDPEFRGSIGASDEMRPLEIPELFHGCPVPVLLMEGRWDLTWNADKPEKLHNCFPGSRLDMFEKAGHAPFDDEPDAFFAALEDFVNELLPDSALKVADWKQSVARIQANLAAEAAFVSDSSEFQTLEPAQADFDRWAFVWVHPNVPEGAKVGYRVRSGSGEVYYKWGPNPMAPADSSRSDFWKGQSDPSRLYGKHIVVTFTTSKGKLEFPPGFTPTFEFYKNGQVIKTIQGIRRD